MNGKLKQENKELLIMCGLSAGMVMGFVCFSWAVYGYLDTSSSSYHQPQIRRTHRVEKSSVPRANRLRHNRHLRQKE